jgi:hypothetical protein
LLFAAAVALPAIRVSNRIAGSTGTAEPPPRRITLLAGTLAVSVLLFSGLVTLANEAWPPVPSLLAAGGALLLGLAAVGWGWDRYVRPLPEVRGEIRTLYHLGRIALVGGALLFF